MITSGQIRAARALLDWSQGRLAERSGLTQSTIANLEVGKHLPSKMSLQSILRAFESVGIEFLPNGVRRQKGIQEFSGKDAFRQLLEDVFFALRDKGGELLISGANERQNRPGVEMMVHKIRDGGIAMRVLVEEGNSHLPAPLEEYRCIASKYFVNNPSMIYGDRVAIVTPQDEHDVIHVIVNHNLANAQRGLFNFLWDSSPMPTRSDIKQAYAPLHKEKRLA